MIKNIIDYLEITEKKFGGKKAYCDENREITFQYAEWTVEKKLRLKKDGAMYVVSPWALTWDDENYYLAHSFLAGLPVSDPG